MVEIEVVYEGELHTHCRHGPSGSELATDAIGAPMFGNAASWVERITKGEEMLINNVMNGINAMPPKGTCGDCSADEIKQTVLYMVANSQ